MHHVGRRTISVVPIAFVVACSVQAGTVGDDPAQEPQRPLDAPVTMDGSPVPSKPAGPTEAERAESHAPLEREKAKLAANDAVAAAAPPAATSAADSEEMDRLRAACDDQHAKEEAAHAEVKARIAWQDAHCTLHSRPDIAVIHCDPVCWKETTPQCPEYSCRGKPPKPEWVPSPNDTCNRDPSRVARAISAGPRQLSPCQELERATRAPTPAGPGSNTVRDF